MNCGCVCHKIVQQVQMPGFDIAKDDALLELEMNYELFKRTNVHGNRYLKMLQNYNLTGKIKRCPRFNRDLHEKKIQIINIYSH